MDKLKYLCRNINLLNIFLIVAIVFLANYTVLPLFNMNIKYSLPVTKKIADAKEEGKGEGEGEKEKVEQVQRQTLSNSDYMIIAEQNLFHPERIIPAEEKQIPKPEFVLYGTMISDDSKIAYLEDLKVPYSTPGRGKRQWALHIGNTLSGYTLNEVYHDKVVMVRGEDKIEVKVSDPSKPKIRDTGVATAAKASEKPGEKFASTPSKQPAALTPSEDERKKLRQDRLRELREKRSKTETPEKAQGTVR